jgi:hypothetical protein
MPTKTSKPAAKSQKAPTGPLPPYGIAIKDAIAGGNVREMKALAARTRKYLADIERALKTLEGRIEKLGG